MRFHWPHSNYCMCGHHDRHSHHTCARCHWWWWSADGGGGESVFRQLRGDSENDDVGKCESSGSGGSSSNENNRSDHFSKKVIHLTGKTSSSASNSLNAIYGAVAGVGVGPFSAPSNSDEAELAHPLIYIERRGGEGGCKSSYSWSSANDSNFKW